MFMKKLPFLIIFQTTLCSYLLLFNTKLAICDIKDIANPVEEVYDIIKSKYLDSNKSDYNIAEGAVNGMMHSLDPYSTFFTEADFLEFQNMFCELGGSCVLNQYK
mgnify:CR=1 FL=1